MTRLLGGSRNNELTSYVIQWLILAAGVWVADQLIDDVKIDGWVSLLITAAILGLLNLFLKPVLERFALPLTLITFGLFLIVINTILVALTARIAHEFDDWKFFVNGIPGDFFWEGFKNSLLAAIVISIVTFVLSLIITPGRSSRRILR